MKKRLFISGIVTTLLVGSLLLPGAAEQLFIRNHPYKGAIVRDSAGMWLDLKEFAAALGAKLVQGADGGFQMSLAEPAAQSPAVGKVAIGKDLLDLKEVDGRSLVSLEDSARLLGLKITPDRTLGILDVNLAVGHIQAAPEPVAAAEPSASPTPTVKKSARRRQYTPPQEAQLEPTQAAKLAYQKTLHHHTAFLTSYDQAVAQSERYSKPILMDFTGSDWCGYCIDLKQRVFDTPEFEKWATAHVVLLELDYPKGFALAPKLKEQNDALAEKYQIGGYPTIIFIDAKGKQLGDYGYDKGGPDVWIKKASSILGFRD